MDPADENWLLISTRYEYIALPMAVGVDVLRHMKMMNKVSRRFELVAGDPSFSILTPEQMAVAIAKAKMLPKEEDE